jgi:hypothetical protein
VTVIRWAPSNRYRKNIFSLCAATKVECIGLALGNALSTQKQKLDHQPGKRGARCGQRASPSPLEIEPLKLLNPLPVRAPQLQIELETVEQTTSFID